LIILPIFGNNFEYGSILFILLLIVSSNSDNGPISGEVLVYKHPGLHFGDIHVLTAIFSKDIQDVVGDSKYAILFPISGPRSLADEMANSDFDGDVYWVSRNPQVSHSS
jgi:RNA-dependent RNA polymerase